MTTRGQRLEPKILFIVRRTEASQTDAPRRNMHVFTANHLNSGSLCFDWLSEAPPLPLLLRPRPWKSSNLVPPTLHQVAFGCYTSLAEGRVLHTLATLALLASGWCGKGGWGFAMSISVAIEKLSAASFVFKPLMGMVNFLVTG